MGTPSMKYNPKKFSGAVWKDEYINRTCLLFTTGQLVSTGTKSKEEAETVLKQYIQLLEILGYKTELCDFKIRTMSAVYELSGSLDFTELKHTLGAHYEPELFNAAMFKRNTIHFTCFHTGKVIMTGIKSEKAIDETVLPTLLELDMLTKSI